MDQEVQRLEAAKKYWKSNNFDPVVGEYYDPDKETDFKKERDEKAKTHG